MSQYPTLAIENLRILSHQREKEPGSKGISIPSKRLLNHMHHPHERSLDTFWKIVGRISMIQRGFSSAIFQQQIASGTWLGRDKAQMNQETCGSRESVDLRQSFLCLKLFVIDHIRFQYFY